MTPQDVFVQSAAQPGRSPASLIGRAIAASLLAWPFLFFAFFFIAAIGAGPLLALRFALYGVSFPLFLYIAAAGLLRIIQTGISMFDVRRYKFRQRIGMDWTLPPSPRVLPVSALVWVCNRADVITDRIERLLALEYPSFEIIVVNDGSTDSTQEILQAAFDLRPVQRIMRRVLPVLAQGRIYVSARHPNLTVVQKPATGRQDSMNYAINLSRFPLICALDADLIPDPQAFAKLTRGFIEDPAHTIAVSSLARFADDASAPKKPSVKLSSSAFAAPKGEPALISASGPQISFEPKRINDLQRVDRITIFHNCWLLRTGVGSVALLPGALSLLKKSEIVATGGFHTLADEDTLDLLLETYAGEDREPNAIRRVVFLPDTLACTLPLDTFQSAARARFNAQRYTLDSVIRHFSLAFGGQGGWESRLALPVFTLASLFAPSLEICGGLFTIAAAAAGAMSFSEAFIPLFGILTLAVTDSVGGVLCEEFSGRGTRTPNEIANLIRTAILHALGYRWLMAGAQTGGTLAYIFGR